MEQAYTFLFGWACGLVNAIVVLFGIYAVFRARVQNGWPRPSWVPQVGEQVPEDTAVLSRGRPAPPLPVAGNEDDGFVLVRRIRIKR